MDGMNMPPYPLAAPAGAADATAERTPARCLNCGAGLDAAFCGACGQRAATHRFTVPRLLRDAASGVLSFDSAALRTAHALATRPGAFIRAYLLGRRQGYVGPLRYYLIVVALNVGAAALLRHRAADARGRASTGTFWDENFVALQIGAAFAVLALLVSATQHLSAVQEVRSRAAAESGECGGSGTPMCAAGLEPPHDVPKRRYGAV